MFQLSRVHYKAKPLKGRKGLCQSIALLRSQLLASLGSASGSASGFGVWGLGFRGLGFKVGACRVFGGVRLSRVEGARLWGICCFGIIRTCAQSSFKRGMV